VRLLADCGNSTIKLGITHDGGLWQHDRLAPHLPALSSFSQPHLQTITELVVLPGAAAATDVVTAWWRAVGGGKPLRVIGRDLAVPDLGQYSGFGIDRAIAGIAACAQERTEVIVIDAGTATTLTAWRVQENLRARFTGGLILPGAAACIAGLAQQAPALPKVEPAFGAVACQTSTPGAISAAVGIGYEPMVAACLAQLRKETGIDRVVMTGGNAGPLLGGTIPRSAYRPSLVLEGMEIMCRAGGAA
jgi:pantothenate kinase type III